MYKPQQKRKRGIKASKVKLHQAMSTAGFKTQSALAEAIADTENLDTIPKDIVSKIFREISVEPSSIERVAKVLGVKAYTLYLSSEQLKNQETDSEGFQDEDENGPLSNHKGRPISIHWRWVAGLCFIALIIIFYFSKQDTQSPDLTVSNLSKISIAALPIEHQKLKAFSSRLQSDIDQLYTSPSYASLALESAKSVWQIVEDLDVDHVIQHEILEYERHLGLIFYIVNKSTRTPIASFTGLELSPTESNLKQFSTKITSAVDDYLHQQDLTNPVLSKDALSFYLQALVHLDKALIEINVRRSFDFLQRTLRISPDFMPAKAVLCDVLVRQSIVNGDKSLLDDAEKECNLVKGSQPNLAELDFAFGQLRRKQGQTDEAIAHYQTVLAEFPEHVDSRLGLAEAYINKVQQTKERHYFELAKQQTMLATNYLPTFWKIPFVDSRVDYFSGEIDQSIQALEKSIAINANFNNVSNLGTSNFCAGNIVQAKDNYIELVELAGSNPLTSNFLGVISFALEDYPLAVEHFDTSLQLMLQEGSEGLYLVWINLADSYKANGNTHKAKEAYRNAILLADKTKMNDPNDKNIEAHIFYSNLHLLILTQGSLTISQNNDLSRKLDELQEGATDHGAFVRIMLSWVELDELEKARPIFQQFNQSCKGYASYPILKRLFIPDKII